MRPISVIPILSRVVEKIIVKQFLWPALDDPNMNDQFAFRPTGSTTAALVYLLHNVYTMFEEGNEISGVSWSTTVRLLMLSTILSF